MDDPTISNGRRTKPPSASYYVLMTPLLLSLTFAAGDARGQDGPEDSEDPKATPVARAKLRPRLLGRWFGNRTEPEPAKLPPLPPAPPGPAGDPAKGGNPASRPPVDPAVKPAQLTNYFGYSYQSVSGIPTGSEPDVGFLRRLVEAYGDEPAEPAAPDPNAPPSRRGYDAPFTAPPMPFSDFIGPVIGVNDTSVFPLMEALYKGPNGQAWKDSRFKIYGWADPSYNASTSRNANGPLAYNIVPNQLELSQQIVILERTLDTVQQDHVDWGFRFTSLYGIDYRYTTAKGYFSNQLLKHNHLYGYDPLQLQLDIYFPHVGDGTIMRIGRYISPLDIEAQLSPDNFLYTHSLMFAYDPYTFTGLQFTTKINDQLTIMYGVHAGNDMAPWTRSSQPNGEILMRYVFKNNKDSLWGGLDSIGKGYYSNGHDDLQVLGFTWSHKFNDKWATMTEQYYIWQRNALLGGTVTNGTPQPYFEGTGPGAKIPGLSNSYGIVNYTSYVIDDKSLLVFRSDCLADFQGQRTGVPGAYFEHTLGYVRHLNSWALIRPEVRFDYTSGQKGYDNGTRRDQFTFSTDLIVRF
jgi:Putative beta-barrel porin-2, OmpL-like. bbp2